MGATFQSVVAAVEFRSNSGEAPLSKSVCRFFALLVTQAFDYCTCCADLKEKKDLRLIRDSSGAQSPRIG